MMDRGLLQLFLSESQVEPVTSLWIVCIKVVDEVEGKHSIPMAVLPASKGVADDSFVDWFIQMLVYLSRYSWLVGFSSAGDPCLVRRFLRLVARRLLATHTPCSPSISWRFPSIGFPFTTDLSRFPSSRMAAAC
jgi:hypothetical protein